MSNSLTYILDTNFLITLGEIGELASLSSIASVVIPNDVLLELSKYDEYQGRNSLNLHTALLAIAKTGKGFSFIDATHEQKSELIRQITSNLEGSNLNFLIELEQQLGNVSTSKDWYRFPSVILLTSRQVKALQNCVSTTQLTSIGTYRKDENNIALEHADMHVCTLGCSLHLSYIISMDSQIWKTLIHVDPNQRQKIVTIFRYLAEIHRDHPDSFIDALIKTIEKRHKFASEITGSFSSTICFFDLEKSVENVLARYVSDVIEQKRWKDGASCAKLFNLKTRVRSLLSSNNPTSISFDQGIFIRDLRSMKQEFINLKTS